VNTAFTVQPPNWLTRCGLGEVGQSSTGALGGRDIHIQILRAWLFAELPFT
jgi:hypothetical protein